MSTLNMMVAENKMESESHRGPPPEDGVIERCGYYLVHKV